MARINNAITFGAGFNISAASPIDSRMRVQYESDLTNAATWNSSEAPLYDGLTTTVMETGDIWVLMDKTKYTDKTTGQGWVNKGKGSDIDDNSSANNKTWSAEKISTELSGKQNTLTAGANIVITNDTISAVIDAGFSVEVVQSLPASGETNTIYFVPISGGTNPDVYDEYMYINNAWEKIGSTEVDLSNYYNKTEVDTLLSGKQATLTASDNIDITNNALKAVGYRYDTSNGAFAEGDRDINDEGTIRPKSSATGVMAHAEGQNCTASGRNSHAEGANTIASGVQTHTEGSSTQATATNAHAEGRLSKAQSYASHAEGYDTEVGGSYGSASSNPKTAGTLTDAGAYAHAEGNATIAYGNSSHAEGKLTFAKGNNSHAEGIETNALGNQSHAEGQKTIAIGTNAHAEGYLSETGGNYTSNTKTAGTGNANGYYAHAEGNATIAQGVGSHSEGQKTFAKGNYSHAEGYETIVLENAAHAEGSLTKVNTSANGSHVEGYNTETGGNRQSNDKTANTTSNAGAFAHAEGNATIAQGVSSHSEGRKTFATGTNSHAEGVQTVANGTNSHAEGTTTVANGGNSHTEGRFTQTLQNAEHAQGSYNKSHTDDTADGFGTNAKRTIHSIGIGTADDARKNAVEVMQNGDAYLLGVGKYDGVYVKGETGAPADLKTLQEVINSKQSALIAGENIVIGASGEINAEGYVFGATSGSFAEKYRQDDEDGGELLANSAYGLGAHAEGYNTTASGDYGSHAEGYLTTASAICSHTEGRQTIASGNYSHAEGRKTTASAEAAHSEGYKTNATARWAHAEGYGSTASGEVSHAEGYETIASNFYAHSEGFSNTASAPCSHAEGIRTIASGEGSHAEGWGHSNDNNNAIGNGSHVEGAITIAQNQSEHAEGFYNKSHRTTGDGTSMLYSAGNTIHSIGIGDWNNNQRKNAVEVMQNGDVYIKGIGNYDGIYIKGETGATSSLQTLQEVVNSKGSDYEVATNDEIRYLFLYSQQNEIIYKSWRDFVVTIENTEGLPTVVSNTVDNGIGKIVFASAVTNLPEYMFDNSVIESIELPDTVITINQGVFRHNIHIRTITLPENVQTIGDNAFYNCHLLEYIEIPKSVTSIGDSVFAYCSKLSSITYTGTMAQWNAINKDTNWKYNAESITAVYCSDGVVNV